LNVGFREELSETKVYPCVTLCPMQGFKDTSFSYTMDRYLTNTFRAEEIFASETLNQLYNTTAYFFKEIYSLKYGRCYTVCVLCYECELRQIFLEISTANNMIAFVHQRGEEFWIVGKKWGQFYQKKCNFFQVLHVLLVGPNFLKYS